MRMQETIGIIATIGIIFLMMIFIINHEYFSNDSLDNISNEVCMPQCSVNNSSNFSWYVVLLEIPVAGTVAYFVWWLTTKAERKNRVYVRNRIVRNYLQCWTIAGALLNIPDNRNNIVDLLSTVMTFYTENIHRMEVHSHLLSPSEIQAYRDQKDVIDSIFIDPLSQNPNDVVLLTEFANFIRDRMVEYITTYKVKTFYEYVN